jgi:hypothetical protein
MRPSTPNPHQLLTHPPSPHQVAPVEVPEKSDDARSQLASDCQHVGGVNGWPTAPAVSDAAGPSSSSQAGGPGLASQATKAAGKPPTNPSVSDTAPRPASSGSHPSCSSLAAPPMPESRARDLALAGGIHSSAGSAGAYPHGVSGSSGYFHDHVCPPCGSVSDCESMHCASPVSRLKTCWECRTRGHG